MQLTVTEIMGYFSFRVHYAKTRNENKVLQTETKTQSLIFFFFFCNYILIWNINRNDYREKVENFCSSLAGFFHQELTVIPVGQGGDNDMADQKFFFQRKQIVSN